MDVFALTMRLQEEGAAQVKASVDKLNRSLKDVGKSASGYDMALDKLKGTVSSLAAGFAIDAVIGRMVAETKEAEFATAQLNAALKSTQGVAGQTIQTLQAHASALSQVSIYDDDVIAGAQALLLTFTKIQGDTFPKATQAVLNVATAMGTDLKSAAIQVGKALNDPILGVTALARSGIQFTEAQKSMIAEMVKANNMMGAQKLILAELETQFGGSAKAARNTFGGAIAALGNDIGNALTVTGDGVSLITKGVQYLSTVVVGLRTVFDQMMLLADATYVNVAGVFRILKAMENPATYVTTYRQITAEMKASREAFGAAYKAASASATMSDQAAAYMARLSGTTTATAGAFGMFNTSVLKTNETVRGFNVTQSTASDDLVKLAKVTRLSAAETLALRTEADTLRSALALGNVPMQTRIELATKLKDIEEVLKTTGTSYIQQLVQLANLTPITTAQQAALATEATRLTTALKSGNLAMEQRIELAKQLQTVETALGNARVKLSMQESAAKLKASAGTFGAPSGPTRGFDVANIDPATLAGQVNKGIAPALDATRAAFIAQMADLGSQMDKEITNVLSNALASGIENAIATGSIGEGFKSVAAALLGGLGDIVQRLGVAMLPVAALMQKLMESMASLNPYAMAAAAVGLIALGASMKGIARRAVGGVSSGTAAMGGTIGGLGISGGGTITTRQFGTTMAGAASQSVAPVQPMNVTIIGPNDPNAQRQIATLMDNAARRGLVQGSQLRTV